MTPLNQAACNVLSCASELCAALDLCKSMPATAAGSALMIAVQAREKLKDAVSVMEEEHLKQFGREFRDRCDWTFEMPPAAIVEGKQ